MEIIIQFFEANKFYFDLAFWVVVAYLGGSAIGWIVERCTKGNKTLNKKLNSTGVYIALVVFVIIAILWIISWGNSFDGLM
jgi:H+/Cl- antiporter ClcA